MGAACDLRPLPFGGRALALTRRWPLLGALTLVSRGPVWAGTGSASWPRALRNALPGALVLNAGTGCDDRLCEAGFFPLLTPVSVAVIDLAPDRATRRARLHSKWRNRLARAEEAPLRVTRSTLPADPGHWLLRQEARQQKHRGYRGLPPAFSAAFAATNPRQAQLFTASDRDGTPVAAMLFLRHGRMASYQIGWSGEAGRRHHAHRLLLWRAMDWLAEQGHSQLDLGALNAQDAPGLARFKLGTGATCRPLGGTWIAHPTLAPLARRLPRRAGPPGAASHVHKALTR
ncbi:GNAT family N-acetyltransferase [Aquicoccus sp. SCR17]|nr:GNAT family N-acetyltransferase [Carideicomes alvinocaridis]